MLDTTNLSAAEQARIEALHAQAIVIDGSIVVEMKPEHFARFRDGGVTAVNHTVTEPYCDYETGLSQINRCHRWIEANSDHVLRATTIADIHEAKRSGREAIIFGPQDTEMMGTDLDRLGTFYDLGVRILQLVYQRQNFLASGCGEAEDAGITKFGKRFIKEMNALGIVVDVSHAGQKSTVGAMEASEHPIMITHSFCAKLSPHIRAKSDDTIRALGQHGGVIGITGLSPYLYMPDKPTTQPTIERLVEHIDHVVELAGIDSVAIGLDYDETFTPEKRAEGARKHGGLLGSWPWPERRCKHLNDAAEFPNITAGLVKRGYSDEDILKILGGNWMRVMQAVWKA
jgi:membrane dipeptidase